MQTVSSGLGRAPNDLHEFTVLDSNSAISTIFQQNQYDLSNYGISQPYGWVVEGIFQEIDISSGEVLFEWQSLDHAQTSLANTYNTYGSNGTLNGSAVNEAWDYLSVMKCQIIFIINVAQPFELRRERQLRQLPDLKPIPVRSFLHQRN